MIFRYDFGAPLDTGAVIRHIPAEKGVPGFFDVSREGEKIRFSIALSRDDMIFGLGQNVRGINKRGHLYRSWNSDEFHHEETTKSLYGSHNFLVFRRTEGNFGVFFDDPGAVEFDLGYTSADRAVITSENGNLSLYIIPGDSLKEIVRSFRRLIGRSYIPPKWAFGYIQSRWGYASEEELRHIVHEHRSRHIPLDGLCVDIDYMEQYKDFTWNSSTFSDPVSLNRDMKEEHVRLIPIIDAGVKEEPGYEIYEEGLERGYFCKKADGSNFIGAVWPGRSLFPDFLREDVRRWFGRKYHALLDTGLEGFWNDMNEPALFYSEEGLEEAYRQMDMTKGENIGIDAFFGLRDIFGGIANSPEDYRRFWHDFHGKKVRHDKVHNLYGCYMTRAAAEGMEEYDSDKRFLLFARSSCIGAHRYGGIWQGDNTSWWSHLLMNLKMMPSLNMCGFLFTGADIGGFSNNTTEDLLLRWLQLGVFTPLMRNHSAQGTREQEIYRFGLQEDMKNILTVRYGLLPYLYSEFMKAALGDECMFRPLAFDYPEDDLACRIEDQVMLGDQCMIAPVYEQNARGRYVYLPEDMLMVRFRSAEDYDLLPVKKGHHWVDLQLNEMPLFIRRGCFIPLSRGAEWVDAVDFSSFTLIGWLDDEASYSLYDDDGCTKGWSLEAGIRRIEVSKNGDGFCARGKELALDPGGLLG
ncbi:MAG: alpha-glucosidase [Clostridiales bacterium]|nr:alpha-glucosidase [Clostridiales bacterium]